MPGAYPNDGAYSSGRNCYARESFAGKPRHPDAVQRWSSHRAAIGSTVLEQATVVEFHRIISWAPGRSGWPARSHWSGWLGEEGVRSVTRGLHRGERT